MKQTVYLDTTILSYLFDERESIGTYIEITKRWWEEESVHFDIWTSEETIAELSKETAYSYCQCSFELVYARNHYTYGTI